MTPPPRSGARSIDRCEYRSGPPNVSGVKFHSVLTVSLNFKGTITHVINDTGATTPSGTTPVNVINYP